MTSALIVSTARTPLAKSWKGAFNMTHGATLGGHAVKAAVERAGIDGALVDDVIMGCATPEGATGRNNARQIALRAGLPITTSGMTINRFCSSGLQTIATAAQRIIAGEGDGVEAGRAEAVDRAAGDGNGQVGPESGLAGDVAAGRAFGIGAAHDHVLDFGRIELGALDGGLHHVSAHRRAVSHVEGTAPGLAERRSCGRYDDGFGHGVTPVRMGWGDSGIRARA